jgi:hypothetical protein
VWGHLKVVEHRAAVRGQFNTHRTLEVLLVRTRDSQIAIATEQWCRDYDIRAGRGVDSADGGGSGDCGSVDATSGTAKINRPTEDRAKLRCVTIHISQIGGRESKQQRSVAGNAGRATSTKLITFQNIPNRKPPATVGQIKELKAVEPVERAPSLVLSVLLRIEPKMALTGIGPGT